MVSTFVSIPGYRISEELYSGSRTIVYRGYRETDSLPVVIKWLKNPYPSFSELLSFRNQYTIAKNLNSPLIVQTYSLEAYQNGYVLVMEDFGGISLKDYFTSNQTRYIASGQQFLEIAIALCNTLDILYRERIIHKDIKPANILINPETKEVKLIDFSIASLLPRETQTVINPNVLEGTLAYISPEQTGRMNRGIDYRTDFYSLGVTFYELLTGELPFKSNEPMELVHSHIAKQPPSVIRDEIPQVISDIVMKLMAKNAEDRYQSALGLKFDLENCLHQLQETGTIGNFEIASRDVCDRFIIPDKLYGRETEVSTLLEAFERVSLGATEIMLVAGFSGIGKTAVVNEVHKPIVRQRGYFIKGKFDQFQRNIPFSAFVQAFRDLIGQLLTESDIQIHQWRNQILEAVGENGQVVIEVLPELSRIIGEQAPAMELSGDAAQNRFNLLFQKFTQVFTSTEHPLVMFLDDLQWADSASLKLIQLLMADTNHLLLIGAYRDNEVNPGHPLLLTLSEIQKKLFTINTITLTPLSQGQVNQLVADTLKCTQTLAWTLSQLVYQKTQGNPFFATQFLKALHQENLIKFDFESGCWQCDIVQVITLAVTDDVVAFMAVQLRKLPQSTQDILQLAACIGNSFDLATLAIVSKQSEIEAATDLWKALQEGLILPLSDVYKFYVGQESLARTPENQETVTYKFLHDRIQQAAYSLIPEDKKQSTHLKIGQLLLNNISEEEQEGRIFEIVNQLNFGVDLLTNQLERNELAKLNLIAGKKAKLSTAYETAIGYLNAGLNLLANDSWESQYDLTLKIYIETVEAEYLNINFDRSMLLNEIALQNSKTLLDQVKLYEAKMQIFIAQLEMIKAIEIGLKFLEKLDISLVKLSDDESLLVKLPNLDELTKLLVMTDPYKLSAMQIIKILCAPVFMAKPEIFPQLIITMINLCIEHGNSALSAFAYGFYGLLMSGIGKLNEGYHAGNIALKLLNEFDAKELKAKVYNLFNSNIRNWKEHTKNSIHQLQEGVQSGLDTGDIEWGGYCAANLCSYLFFSTNNLEYTIQQQAPYIDICVKIKQEIPTHFSQIWRQLGLNLLDLAQDKYLLIGDSFDEAEKLPCLIAAKSGTVLFIFYVAKTILIYQFGDYTQALKLIDLAHQQAGSAFGFMQVVILNFYHSLALSGNYLQAELNEQQKYLKQIEANQEKMRFWAYHAPMNNQHRYDLVEAEKAQILRQYWEAADLYDRAISGAKANGYIQEEALSNELAAKFYLDWGKEKVAQAYMHQAYYCYARWGAKAKIEDLEKRYPQLLQPILQQQRLNLNPSQTITFHGTSSYTRTNSTGSTNISDVLDFTSVLKAAQAISSSLELDQLIANLTRIILENSGAKKSALILPQDDDTWQVRAITFIEHGEIQTILNSESIDNCQDIPINIINYVKNTQETVVIDNCKTDIPGIIGEYILQYQPQSVLCTPIINQGHLVGILYLENQLTLGVFTSDRLSVINFLCTQAAISLENAQLYNHLQERGKFLSSIYEGVGCLIFVTDIRDNGRFEYTGWSKSCELALGIPAYKVLGKSPQELLASDEGAAVEQKYLHCFQTGIPVTYEECLTFNDQKTWFLTTLSPLKDETGKVYRVVGTTINITARKQAEEVVTEKSQALGTALANLQQAQLQVVQSEKMSALGNLVAGVAHEMNNPLGFISASLKQAKPTIADIVEHLKLYQESLPSKSEEILDHAEEIDLEYSLEDLPKMLDSMSMACDRLKNISTSLRTFSRADRDYKVPFNIHQGIDSTILILKHRLKANEQRPTIEVVTNYGDLPQIECFPGQLNQVFMNLIANAIDALDESNTGRSFEEIKASPNCITITTSVENNLVKIAIADNAKGMNEQVKSKIFDHLFTTKAVGKGTGLGLAIAKSIVVEKHGGSIDCISVPGQGTKFIIQLLVG
ncbi:AAA family ATPase [Scytonema hofmannii FACHB-248]|uniref:histidine kinase n=1 Tax=Scytonema hofmannii FACHB-248 TaxID=1842502 RepID=A0ABR8GIY8_9CYAN|nr:MULTISPECIES: AAA family ATPase [Nostocales]MBD2603347.1 AAA family ATPase [Scytonema hofmannii FACHB-248]